MNKNLLILGAGQYGMLAKEVAESMGTFEKIDFLDDNSELAIDKLANYKQYARKYSYAVVAIGNADIRLEYIRKLEEALFEVAVLVSPMAYIAPSVQLSKGTIVEPMAVVNTNTTVATGVIICSGAIVNHNAAVGDGCLLQCGSVVAAGTVMERKDTLGYNETFKGFSVPIDKRTPAGNGYKFEDGM